MAGWIPPSLRRLLGNDLDEVDESGMARLLGVVETDQLDFKSEMYKASEGDRRELCRDIAQFANSGGGLLILGVTENNSVATELAPFPSDPSRPDYCLWIDQTIMSGVFPAVSIHRRSIASSSGGSYVVISVPPSFDRPHAVKVNNGFEYPSRAGSTRRALSEMEIARAYQRRSEAAADLRLRADSVQGEAVASLGGLLDDLKAVNPASATVDQQFFNLWTVVSATPSVPGDVSMHRTLPGEWLKWLEGRLAEVPRLSGSSGGLLSLLPRYKALELRSYDAQMPYDTRCVLRLDGGGYLALATTARRIGGSMVYVGEEEAPGFLGVSTLVTVTNIAASVWTLAAHAARTGSLDALTFEVQLVAEAAAPQELAIPGYGIREDRIQDRTLPAVSPTPAVVLSVELDSLPMSSIGTLEVTRLLSRELFSHFGLAEAPEFDDDGSVRRDAISASAWREQYSNQFFEWVERFEV